MDRIPLMADICEQIAQGKSLREICKADGMPAPSTVCLWLSEDDKLAEQYAHAREQQADLYADEIIEIADTAKNEDAQVARLRVDARKWKASKLAPKRYGDKMDLNHGGTLKIEGVRRTIYDPRNPDSPDLPAAP
jgi:phosphoribosylaminoimidazole-succinocarboxamide synthase